MSHRGSKKDNQKTRSKGNETPVKSKSSELPETESPATPGNGEKETGQNTKQSTLDKHLLASSNPEKSDLEKSLMTIHSRLEASQEYIQNLAKAMLTEKVLKTSLEKLKEDIQDHIKQELSKVYKKVETLKQSVKTVEGTLSELKDTTCGLEIKLETLERENKKLKKENENLHTLTNQQTDRIKIAEKDLNELEQYTRRNSIRIYGIEDTNKSESESETAKRVMKLVNDKLHVKINEEDIDIAHRIGKFDKEANRPVICKFVTRTKKMEVIRNRKKLKGTATVIREDLTYKNAKRLEKTSENESVEAAWSDNGKIIALMKNKKKIVIDYKVDLTKPLLM